MKTAYISICLVAVFAITFSFSGCNEGKSRKIGQTNDIRFDSITVDKVYHLLDNPDNPNCNLQIKFVYPSRYTDNEILAKIQRQFISNYFGDHYQDLAPEEAVKQYTDEYIRNYQSLEDDFKEELEHSADSPLGAWFSYYETSYNEITYNKNDLVGYSIYYESYTGGAHGAHSIMNHVINLETGELLTEEEVFNDNYQDALADILVNHIAGGNNLSDPKELENIGFFSIDEIYPNGNFLVDDEGITYDFNEYEIAAYVVGITRVKLPYKEIRHLLRKESPLSSLIDN